MRSYSLNRSTGGSFTATEEGRFSKEKEWWNLLHKDIVAWTCRKGDLLCALHEKRTGEAAPPSKVILVFSNKNLGGGRCHLSRC